jgi:S-(hydroxymethyl)glutathione dehydrogenase/alcohol dehydrogenase
MEMRAAVLVEPGAPLALLDAIEIPPLERGQLLVRILHTGVCHSQLMEATGQRGHDPWVPHLLGHEATAEVVEIGDGVTRFRPGQRVVLTWIKCSGLQAQGARYRRGGMVINSGAVTTFSEYSVVSENRCVELPEGVPADIGSLFGCAVMTGAGIVVNTLTPKPGSSIAIFGAGGIGLSSVMAALLEGCSPIIAIDVEPVKLAMATAFGATHAIDATKCDPVTAVREIVGSEGVDYSIDAAGIARTIEQAFAVVRKGGGRCVFASHPAAGEKICLDPFDLISGKRIEGSWGGESLPERDVPRFARLYLEGRLPLDKLITHRYRLEQLNEAMSDMAARRVGRPMVDLQG